MKRIVIAILPRYGLCNRLFVWANAVVFSEINQLPLNVNGWYKTPIGPWLRNEKVKRFYAFYFKNNTNIFGSYFRRLLYTKSCDYNPKFEVGANYYKTFVFNAMPLKKDYFKELMPYKELLTNALVASLKNTIRKDINNLRAVDFIGVHIRLGDFILINKNQSLQYYIDAINYVRDILNYDLPVKIFTDGYENEIKEILDLNNVQLAQNTSDIVDLINLSKATVIVTTIDSTFSYWAAFMSNAIVVHPMQYNHISITGKKLKEVDNLRIEI